MLSSQEANYLMVPSAMCLLRASAGGQGASMPLCPGCTAGNEPSRRLKLYYHGKGP